MPPLQVKKSSVWIFDVKNKSIRMLGMAWPSTDFTPKITMRAPIFLICSVSHHLEAANRLHRGKCGVFDLN